jgi:pimeloyl-ACP methyl ester carboxylesterase
MANQAASMDPQPFTVKATGVSLSGEEAGPEGSDGDPIVLMHGLTATRRYVVHGSRHLPRHGFRVIGYDARGHGASEAPAAGSYDYERLADDAWAVAEARVGEGRAVLAGHSMGAHTAAALALRDPAHLAGLVLICPAVTGTPPSAETMAYWEALAAGLESDGVEGFIAAYARDLPADWSETLLRITRQRLSLHDHPEGVARALREVPRSVPFDGLAQLESLDLPVLVVASHDDADAAHPYAVAKAWAERVPQSRLISEEPGQSPLAWQGGRLSREIAEFCSSEAVRERRGRRSQVPE